VDNSIKKYADIERSIRENLDTWLCNLYFSLEPREPLTNPYTTQLDLDNEEHQKIAQVLEVGEDDEIQGRKFSINDGGRYAQVSPHEQHESSMIVPYAEKTDLINNNVRIAELLRDETEEDEFDNTHEGKKAYMPLVNPEDYDAYTYHIPRIEIKSRVAFTNQVAYIVDEVLADLGFRNVLSFEFWMSAIILLLCMWGRAYVHPFGSWIFLKANSIPVTSFTALLYGFDLEYPMTTIGIEIGVTLCGNVMVTFSFLFFIFLCWFLERYIHGTPVFMYRVVASYGIAVVADFVLLAVVDLSNDNQDGELWKLFNFYNRIDKSGFIGLFITLFIYFAIIVANSFIFYTYIVFLHVDGRLVDLYTRVSAGREHFFVPYDNEISARALRQVLEKVKRENNSLKGTPGMKHVAITHHEINWKTNTEKSSYIALYEKCADGRLELFRHFIRLSNGSICELEQQLAYKVDDYPLFEEGAPNPANVGQMSEISGIAVAEEGKKMQFMGEELNINIPELPNNLAAGQEQNANNIIQLQNISDNQNENPKEIKEEIKQSETKKEGVTSGNIEPKKIEENNDDIKMEDFENEPQIVVMQNADNEKK